MSDSQTFNPYEPPRADLVTPPARPELASRWRRLGGALVDGTLALLATAPVFLGISFQELVAAAQHSDNPFTAYVISGTWGAVAGALTLALYILQWYLVATRGSSLGKMVAGTRIVQLDDSPAGFGRGVAVRAWIPMAVSWSPVVGNILSLIDVLFIFGEERRCFHDLIAGTRVVLAGEARPAAHTEPLGGREAPATWPR